MSFEATGRAATATTEQTGIPEPTETKETRVPERTTQAVATTTEELADEETAGITDQETYEIAHDLFDIFGEFSAEHLETLSHVEITDPVTKKLLMFRTEEVTRLAEFVEKGMKKDVSRLIRMKFM